MRLAMNLLILSILISFPRNDEYQTHDAIYIFALKELDMTTMYIAIYSWPFKQCVLHLTYDL